jgi:hypothetical protein
MLTEDFENLRNHIHNKNNYFHHGFANAFRSDVTGSIWAQKLKDMQCLLPDDTLGDYFYLRTEAGIKYDPQQAERLADGGPQRLSFLDTAMLYLIAIVRGADAFRLIENLRNAAMSYADMNVLPIAASWNREQVVTEELTKMKSDDVAAALKRYTDETVVRLTMNVSKTFVPGNCIVNPVKL